MKSCLIISDVEQAESLACSIYINRHNIIFRTSYLKYAFFSKIKIYYPSIKIINCDSSKKRFFNDIKDYDGELIIFDKVNYCEDFDIFNMINNMNRILIC